jgi:hypothetical protein
MIELTKESIRKHKRLFKELLLEEQKVKRPETRKVKKPVPTKSK